MPVVDPVKTHFMANRTAFQLELHVLHVITTYFSSSTVPNLHMPFHSLFPCVNNSNKQPSQTLYKSLVIKAPLLYVIQPCPVWTQSRNREKFVEFLFLSHPPPYAKRHPMFPHSIISNSPLTTLLSSEQFNAN